MAAMQVFGIGLDLVEIARVRLARDRTLGFLPRILTAREREIVGTDLTGERLAGRFAAKEAVGKAIGVALSWHDVEILPDVHGRPTVHLHHLARELVGDGAVLLSITHNRSTAAATAIWVSE